MNTPLPTLPRQSDNNPRPRNKPLAHRTTTLLTRRAAAAVIGGLLLGMAGHPPVQAQSAGGCLFGLAPAQDYGVGLSPRAVVTGDFNGDGEPDVATADRDGHNVSVLMNNGDGTFTAAQNYGVGNFPEGLVAGDFNGDGNLDLGAGNAGSGFVSILLGDGAGGFTPGSNASVPNPSRIAAADFNGDGILDLATTQNLNQGLIHILLGNGDGTFDPPQAYGIGAQPRGVTTGDFNGDGKLDVVAVNDLSNDVSVLLNNGDGTFAAAQNFDANARPTGVTTGDFNMDGKLDLAIAELVSSRVSVLLGNGDGTFAAPQSIFPSAPPNAVTASDLDGDGKTDLAAALNNGTIAILLGNGDGTFASPQNFGVGATPFSVATADFDADGKLDLAVANRNGHSVSILLNTSVCNTAPTLTCPAAATIDCAPAGGVALAVQTSITDPDPGQTLTVTLLQGTDVLDAQTVTSPAANTLVTFASLTFAPGTHPLAITVSDGIDTASCATTITIHADTAPPIPNLAALPAVIAQCSAARPAAPTATDACDGLITATTTAPATFGQGNFTIVWTFTDSQGNSTTQNQQVQVQDTMAPVLSGVPANLTATATSAAGAVVTFALPSASDNCSGSVPVTCSHASGSTFPAGTTTVTCTATDAAGNRADASFTVTVVYSWSDVLQPINADGSSVFKRGRTVPVKFRLTGASAGITTLAARLSYALVSNSVPGPVNEADSTSAATTGNLFRYDATGGQYIFNWSTSGLAAGTYQLIIDLGDGVSHTVTVALR